MIELQIQKDHILIMWYYYFTKEQG